MRLNRLVRASHRKDESFFLGVISSHWRIFKEAVAWSDANFNAAGWNSDPLNPLALLILSLAGGLLFNSNRSKIFHGRQSLVATEKFVGLLESLFWRMRRARGKEPAHLHQKKKRKKRWRPYKDALQGELNTHWVINNKWHLSHDYYMPITVKYFCLFKVITHLHICVCVCPVKLWLLFSLSKSLFSSNYGLQSSRTCIIWKLVRSSVSQVL